MSMLPLANSALSVFDLSASRPATENLRPCTPEHESDQAQFRQLTAKALQKRL